VKLLTEAEVRARLDKAIAEAGDAAKLARIHKVDPTYIYCVVSGRYLGGGVPPRILEMIGVRKRCVYELIEGKS